MVFQQPESEEAEQRTQKMMHKRTNQELTAGQPENQTNILKNHWFYEGVRQKG